MPRRDTGGGRCDSITVVSSGQSRSLEIRNAQGRGSRGIRARRNGSASVKIMRRGKARGLCASNIALRFSMGVVKTTHAENARGCLSMVARREDSSAGPDARRLRRTTHDRARPRGAAVHQQSSPRAAPGSYRTRREIRSASGQRPRRR
jgi:hypothetical protein